jgi:hypothetical protein
MIWFYWAIKIMETDRLIAFIGMFALLASGGAWWIALHQPELEPAGGRLVQASRRANWAAAATFTALGLSVAAAAVAIFERLF